MARISRWWCGGGGDDDGEPETGEWWRGWCEWSNGEAELCSGWLIALHWACYVINELSAPSALRPNYCLAPTMPAYPGVLGREALAVARVQCSTLPPDTAIALICQVAGQQTSSSDYCQISIRVLKIIQRHSVYQKVGLSSTAMATDWKSSLAASDRYEVIQKMYGVCFNKLGEIHLTLVSQTRLAPRPVDERCNRP